MKTVTWALSNSLNRKLIVSNSIKRWRGYITEYRNYMLETTDSITLIYFILSVSQKGEITILQHSQDWQDSKKKARTKR